MFVYLHSSLLILLARRKTFEALYLELPCPLYPAHTPSIERFYPLGHAADLKNSCQTLRLSRNCRCLIHKRIYMAKNKHQAEPAHRVQAKFDYASGWHFLRGLCIIFTKSKNS